MNTVRIIGGQWRRRLIKFPARENLRPTPDRVRETLFNWLGQDLTGKRCLDLFAGSGALGIEAASRGAAEVIMVEHTAKTAQALVGNIQQLGAETVKVYQRDALAFLTTTRAAFDIIFLDPPYHQGWIEQLMPVIPARLHSESLLYIEAEKPFKADAHWQVLKHGHAGHVYYHLVQPKHSIHLSQQESKPCETIA